MLETKPVQMFGESGEARLVFADGALVALLLCLSDAYESDCGRWHLEWAHNGVAHLGLRMFSSLQEAEQSIREQLAA
jgi:hypothetical protein